MWGETVKSKVSDRIAELVEGARRTGAHKNGTNQQGNQQGPEYPVSADQRHENSPYKKNHKLHHLLYNSLSSCA